MFLNLKSPGVQTALLAIGLLASVVIWVMQSIPAAPIRIGLAVNLSGHGGTAGEYIREGALLAVEEANMAGGINGQPLELLISDDRNTREGIIAADRELLEQGVLAIIGHVTSNSSLIAYPEITSRGVLMFTPYTATTELSGLDDLFIRTSVDTRQYAQAMANLLRRNQAESVVFIMDMSNPSFVVEYADLTNHYYSGRTRQIRFNPNETISWGSILAEIQTFNPDAVVFLTEVGMTGIAAQKLRENGYTGPLMATLWAQTPDLIRFGGAAVEGLSLVTFIDLDNQRPELLKFSDSMQARVGQQANARSARGYEAVKILVEALKACPQPTAGALKQQLLAQQFDTLLGTVRFDEYGDVVRQIIEVKVEAGRFVRVATLK